MSKYKMGKDVGRLLARVEALEAALHHRCSCGPSSSEMVVRQLTEEEQSELKRKRGTQWCTYSALSDCAPLGIKFMEDICVQPCPPCPDVIALRVVNAAGREICTIRVRWSGAGHCTDCPPGGHRFVWV